MHTAMTPAIGIPASLIERISYTAIDIGTVGHCGAKQGTGGKMALDRDIRIRWFVLCWFARFQREEEGLNWFNEAYFGV